MDQAKLPTKLMEEAIVALSDLNGEPKNTTSSRIDKLAIEPSILDQKLEEMIKEKISPLSSPKVREEIAKQPLSISETEAVETLSHIFDLNFKWPDLSSDTNNLDESIHIIKPAAKKEVK